MVLIFYNIFIQNYILNIFSKIVKFKLNYTGLRSRERIEPRAKHTLAVLSVKNISVVSTPQNIVLELEIIPFYWSMILSFNKIGTI